MGTRTIDILDYAFLNAGVMQSIFLFPYKFGDILHCPGEETHPGDEVHMQLSDMWWSPRIVIQTAGQDVLF